MQITEIQLMEIFPHAKLDKIKTYTAAFNAVLPKYGFHNWKRWAAFLGQIGVESGELKYDTELRSKYNTLDPADKSQPTGNAYDGRKATLGNYVPGDGSKYIGRGILQITGRANYNRYGTKLNLPLIDKPELASDPVVATKIACEYFLDRNINSHADAWNLDKVTELVNGTAKLHNKERKEYSNKALAVLTEGDSNVA
jgi:putative chitinase